MLDRIPDRNIWLVYAAIFILGVAYGISLALTPLHLTAHGFTVTNIGSLTAWFALGIVLLSLPMGELIRRFSARGVLIVSLFGYAAMIGLFPFMRSYVGVAAVRFLDGAFSVGIWTGCETILLSRSNPSNKAFVNSLYGISMAVGYIVGPMIAYGLTAVAPMWSAFILSASIATTSGVLVMLRLDRDAPHDQPDAELAPPPSAEPDGAGALAAGGGYRPAPVPPGPPPTPLELLWRIKTSCFATFSYGYFQASIVPLIPLYLMGVKHIPQSQTILISAFFAAGMVLLSSFTARASDRIGHLRVMSLLGTFGTTMVLGFVYLDSFPAICGAVFVAGATLASISPVSLALQGVIVARRDLPRAIAMFNVFYAAGMLLGPIVSSVVYARAGGVTMFYTLAALWATFVAFTLVFRKDDPAAARRLGADAARSAATTTAGR